MSTTAACLIAALVVTCGLLIVGTLNSSHGPHTFSSILALALSAYIMALVVIVIFAIPFRYFARRWHFARGWMVVTIGTVVGLLLVASLQFALTHSPILAGSRHTPFSILYIELGLIGAVGGGALWACCYREMRPNTSLERTREG